MAARAELSGHGERGGDGPPPRSFVTKREEPARALKKVAQKMTKINLKYVDPAMMSNTEAIGRVKFERLPAEVTGKLSAVEGAANAAYRAFNGAMDLVEAATAEGDPAAVAKAEKEAGDIAAVWQPLELDRVALLLHRGLSLQGRAVLEVYV